MPTVPLSGTNIRLMSGVPFYNDYKNTRWFDNITSQTTYFMNRTLVHSMSDATFQRIEGQHFIKANKSIDELWGANYLMFQNTTYNSKWFYGFVTKLEYVQKNVTYVHFHIDVVQTWMFNMTFKPSFVVREHCPLWNTDGTPVINTIDEGLNYGSEYDNIATYNVLPFGEVKFMVIIMKNPVHTTDKKITPTTIGTPQPLTYYILPFTDDDLPANVTGGGASYFLCSKPSLVMNALYTDTNNVNNVVSIYVTDHTGIPSTYDEGTNTVTFSGCELEAASLTPTGDVQCVYVKKVDTFAPVEKNLGAIYDDYEPVTESKLLMYPYTQLVFDDFRGSRFVYKNEYINGAEIKVLCKGSLGISNKVSYAIKEYSAKLDGYVEQLSDESALINNTPNDVPVIVDLLAAYIQGNKNSLQAQQNSIVFNGLFDAVSSVTNGMGMAALGASTFGVAGGVLGGMQGVGNTVLSLQAMQAKQKDIANIPANIAKMGSNTSYTLGNNFDGLYVIKKQIKGEYRKKLEDFFKMFGYKVHEVKVPNLHTRQNWNYVQTESCNIVGNVNNEDLIEFKAAFDNGITLWHTDDVGNYGLGNEVL